MCGKEGDISEKTAPLKNHYKNSLNNIDDSSNISPILILNNSMVYLLILPSLLPEKNLIYELVSRITLLSPVQARVAYVKKIC